MKGGDLRNYFGGRQMDSRHDAERCFYDLCRDSQIPADGARTYAAKAAVILERQREGADAAGPASISTTGTGRPRVRVRFPWESDSAGIDL